MSQRETAPRFRGRGARSNVSGRYEAEAREVVAPDWPGDAEDGRLRSSVSALSAKTLVTYNRSPDLSFDRTINPYKGCEHGCSYCYARPNHAYLGLSPGLDFETKLFWKPDAPAVLARDLAKRGYVPQPIALGADTDPYQPIERDLKSTRQILEVLLAHRHPVGITTKNALVTRDLDILRELAGMDLVKVALSITTLDKSLARAMEPRASTVAKRLEAVETLSGAGVPVMVMTAPVIPGLTDHEIEALLQAGSDAGAREAGYVMLRLPLEIETLFQEWLESERPGSAGRVMRHVREMRGGKAYEATWHVRGRGRGPYAQLIAARFRAATKRLGLNAARFSPRTDLFRPIAQAGQRDLFDDGV